MRRALKILLARCRLRLASVDLDWSRISCSSNYIQHKQAIYNKELLDLVEIETNGN